MDTKTCPICGTPLLGKKKYNTYCSRSCSASRPNPTRTANNAIKRGRAGESRRCRECKAVLVNPVSIYCSTTCQQTYVYKKRIEEWLAGRLDLSTAAGCSVTARRYLLEEAGHRCSRCGWGEVNPATKRAPLEINHIDGNASSNSRANLEVLCPNCHSLTPNYRALNTGSSRRYRRSRP
jgi:hypothetical protein